MFILHQYIFFFTCVLYLQLNEASQDSYCWFLQTSINVNLGLRDLL